MPFIIGRIPWNKGLSPAKEVKKKISEANKGRIPWNKGKTCSEETKKKISEFQKGRSCSEEAKRKISKRLKGKPKSEEHRRKLSEAKMGQTLSDKTKQKMRETTIRRGSQAGSNNPNWGKCGPLSATWQGGLKTAPYCDVWLDKNYKKDIKKRDNCVAWDCGNWPKGGLSIHHIDYNKKNCKPSNLITLSVGGNARANFDREWYKKYYQILMNHKYGYVY